MFSCSFWDSVHLHLDPGGSAVHQAGKWAGARESWCKDDRNFVDRGRRKRLEWFSSVLKGNLISLSTLWVLHYFCVICRFAYYPKDKAYIGDRNLWTTKEVWQIGHCAWHFRRNFAFPLSYPASMHLYVLRLPHRDKITEIRSIELIRTLPISHKIEQKTFFPPIGQYGYQRRKILC